MAVSRRYWIAHTLVRHRPGAQFLIWAGAHEIDRDGTPYITKKKLVHEKYAADGAVANDIALLFVREEIKFSKCFGMRHAEWPC